MVASIQPGTLIARKYRIVAELGAGGMGVVYEAINVDTDGSVALKWLHPQLSRAPEAVERFKREAKIAGRIQHPNVVGVHDCGEHEGQLYLVMELLRGQSLGDRFSRHHRAPPEEAARIMLQVARGMAAAHAAGVLHRDLKPENVFLCESPDGLDAVPKVLDFGIAKLFSDADHTALSAHSGLMGTYQYMAPEQLHRKRDLDARVDVYGLGVVLFRLLTGELPYHADNPIDLALQILQSEPPLVSSLVPEVPQALSEVVCRAIARDRDERFPSVDALGSALEPFTDGLRFRGGSRSTGPILMKRAASEASGAASQVSPVLATGGTRSPSAKPTLSRKPAALGGITGLLLTAALGAALGAWVFSGSSLGSPHSPRPSKPRAPVTGASAPQASPALAEPPELPPVAGAIVPEAHKPGQAELPLPPGANADWASPEAPPPLAAVVPAQEPRKAREASMRVVVVPFGRVWIDGRPKGSAPVETELPAGRHVISVGLRDAPTTSRVVHLAGGQRRELEFDVRNP